MTTEVLRRHFSRMGARLKVRGPGARQGEKVRIDVGRDRDGEFFDVCCQDGLMPEILDVQPDTRHLVLMVRDGSEKNKFLLGHDERHWFAAAVPGDNVRDVRTAIDSLRPTEVEGLSAIRQGEWFFVPASGVEVLASVIYRNERLSRGSGSKPHICEELMRQSGVAVMVSSAYPTGIDLAGYDKLMATDPAARRMAWRRMVLDPPVYARRPARRPEPQIIHLDGCAPRDM